MNKVMLQEERASNLLVVARKHLAVYLESSERYLKLSLKHKSCGAQICKVSSLIPFFLLRLRPRMLLPVRGAVPVVRGGGGRGWWWLLLLMLRRRLVVLMLL